VTIRRLDHVGIFVHERSSSTRRRLEAMTSERLGKHLDVPLGSMHADPLPVRDQSRGLLDTDDRR